MRRPLGTGLPQALTGSGTYDTVYTLVGTISDLQSRVNLVTLYAIVCEGTPGADTVDIRVVADGTDIDLTSIAVTALNTAQASNRASVKILDRFPMRGEDVLKVASSAAQGTQKIYIVGYVELEGELNPPQPRRPFQPSNDLASPYTYAPVDMDTVGTATVHLLEEGYIDEITLNMRMGSDGDYDRPFISINDGDDTENITPSTTLGVTESFLLLDGIPIQGQSSSAIIILACAAEENPTAVWGSFTRR